MSTTIAEEKIDTVPLPEQKIGTWPTPEVRELQIPTQLLKELEGPAGLVIRQGWTVGLPISIERCKRIVDRSELKDLVAEKFIMLLVPK